MTPPAQTKLMKLVCKRAGLTREPLRDSSWSKKKDSIEKKSSVPVNKTGERFRLKLTKLSVAKSWALIRTEWITVKQIQLFQEKKQCLCGRGNLKFVTYLKNKENQNEIIAGNCCLLTLKS